VLPTSLRVSVVPLLEMGTGDLQLHYEAIETRARPARVAVLTDSSDTDWRQTVMRIIEVLSSVWGGKHSLIIPTDGSTIEPLFWTILEKFSPDYVFQYAKTGADVWISRPEEYAACLENIIKKWHENDEVVSDQERDRIDQDLRHAWVGAFDLRTELCSQIANRVIPFHFESNFERVTIHSIPSQLTSIEDVLLYGDHPESFTSFEVPPEVEPVWWAATAGRYSGEFSKSLRGAGLNEHPTRVSVEDLGNFASWVASSNINSAWESVFKGASARSRFVAPDQTRPTSFDLTMSRVAFYGPPLSLRASADRFALVLGDSLADFCLSYCLPRIGHRAVWLPSPWIRGLQASENTPLKSCVVSAVYAAPYRVRSVRGLKVCSVSEDAEARVDLLELLKKYVGLGLNGGDASAVEAAEVVGAATNARTPYCLDSPNQSEIYPFLGDRSVGTIRTPRPTGFSRLNAVKHRWVAEVSVAGRAVPSIPHIADHLVILPQSVGTLDVRVSHHSLAYACPGSGLIFNEDIIPNLRHPQIGLFDTFTAVKFIAADAGLRCELSDKGIYQRDSLQKLGGVAEAARLFRDQSRQVFAKYLDHSKREKGIYDEGCVLHGDKRTYLDLRAVQKVMGGDEDAAVSLLDRLTGLGVLYRGFVLQCAACKHAEWYSLANLSDRFQCTRCGREQTIRREHWRQPTAPQIFYKLDEIVYQFLKSDGDVVALGLDYMSQNSSHPFNYSPEIKFVSNDGTFTGEIDLCAVWNGELIIGEAKRLGTLANSASEENKIIYKYAHLATVLHARQVVFCTTSPEWKNSTREAIAWGFHGKLAEPLFLSADNLFGKLAN
jgi:hypothetical protein